MCSQDELRTDRLSSDIAGSTQKGSKIIIKLRYCFQGYKNTNCLTHKAISDEVYKHINWLTIFSTTCYDLIWINMDLMCGDQLGAALK